MNKFYVKAQICKLDNEIIYYVLYKRYLFWFDEEIKRFHDKYSLECYIERLTVVTEINKLL